MIEYWRDFDIEMTKAPSGDVTVMTNFDAIHNSLSNIFQTMQGSRRMMPTFALPIYRLLFEPVDKYTGGKLADATLGAIQTWETRITVEAFNIIADPDNNLYEVTLTYRIRDDFSDQGQMMFTTIMRAQ